MYIQLGYSLCSYFSTDKMCWHVGVFLAVSSNTRYQIINGLERVVEASPVAKRVHLLLWLSQLVFVLPIISMVECSLWIGLGGVVFSNGGYLLKSPEHH